MFDRKKMRLLWVVVISCLGHAPVFSQHHGDAIVTASLVSPAEVSAQQATKLLLSPTPGILTITIPGASANSTLDLTATGMDVATGMFTFSASGANTSALSQLMEQLSAGALSGSLSTGLTVSGFVNGQGVQIVVLEASQSGDGGTIKATITFD